MAFAALLRGIERATISTTGRNALPHTPSVGIPGHSFKRAIFNTLFFAVRFVLLLFPLPFPLLLVVRR